MSDVLARICNDKKDHVARCKAEVSLSSLEEKAKVQAEPRGFYDILRKQKNLGLYGLIAEIKKASPSRGLIREDFNPSALAQSYQKAGANCLSVLTDQPYFQGRDQHLVAAREAVDLPVLRKDFMLDPYQIVESRALGADAVLIIMAALTNAQAGELEDLAFEWGMSALIEVHNAEEMERALTNLRSPLIGINNRDLKTLKVDLTTTEELAPMVDDKRLLVTESGLGSRDDLARMRKLGATTFLIGESLMRQADVEAATRKILSQETLF